MRVELELSGSRSVIFCLVCPGYLHVAKGLITAEQTTDMPHGGLDRETRTAKIR